MNLRWSLAGLLPALGVTWSLLHQTSSEHDASVPPEPALMQAAPAAPTRAPASPPAEQYELSALLSALAPRWRALALVPADQLVAYPSAQALLQDSVTQLQPWLARQPQTLWPAMRHFGPHAQTLGMALIGTVLRTDAPTALRHAAALAAALPERAESLYAALLEPLLQRRDYALLLQALSQAPLSEEARARLQQETMARWAETDGARAASWALQSPAAAPWLSGVQDRWINQDARGATAFASSLPAGPQRTELLQESLSRWLALDGAAAREWLRTQAPQPELDTAIALHAGSDELLRHQPEEAVALSQRINNPTLRWQTWVTMARNMSDVDPALAEQLPAHLPLGADERARLWAEARETAPRE